MRTSSRFYRVLIAGLRDPPNDFQYFGGSSIPTDQGHFNGRAAHGQITSTRSNFSATD